MASQRISGFSGFARRSQCSPQSDGPGTFRKNRHPRSRPRADRQV